MKMLRFSGRLFWNSWQTARRVGIGVAGYGSLFRKVSVPRRAYCSARRVRRRFSYFLILHLHICILCCSRSRMDTLFLDPLSISGMLISAPSVGLSLAFG